MHIQIFFFSILIKLCVCTHQGTKQTVLIAVFPKVVVNELSVKIKIKPSFYKWVVIKDVIFQTQVDRRSDKMCRFVTQTYTVNRFSSAIVCVILYNPNTRTDFNQILTQVKPLRIQIKRIDRHHSQNAQSVVILTTPTCQWGTRHNFSRSALHILFKCEIRKLIIQTDK